MFKNILVKLGLVAKENYVPDCRIYKTDGGLWYAKVKKYIGAYDGYFVSWEETSSYDTVEELMTKIYTDAAEKHINIVKQKITENHFQIHV